MPRAKEPREKMAKQLLKNGHASILEILTASFGEWPPKGLDINLNVPHDQSVEFRPLGDHVKDSPSYMVKNFFSRCRARFKEAMNVYGRANLVGYDRVIWINRLQLCTLPGLFGQSNLNKTMGHEAIHILQGDNHYRVADLYGGLCTKVWEDHPGVASNLIMKQFAENNYKFPQKGLLRRIFRRSAQSKKEKRFIYLKEGIEVQARLHEVMISGYKRWGRMPQDINELWGALASVGLQPPADISKILKSMPKESDARKFADTKNGLCYAAIDIQTINKSLVPKAKEIFWHETLPALYADMIEMYGDRQGRERFGFGPNIKGQIQESVFGKDNQNPASLPAPASKQTKTGP